VNEGNGMNRRDLLTCIAIGSALVVGGCGRWYRPYRYRLTVEVDTPEGLKTGSSVIEVSSDRSPKWMPQGGGVSKTARGQAVAVDLPDGQTLFALLRSNNGNVDWPAYAAYTVIEVPAPSTGQDDQAEFLTRAKAAEGKTLTLPRDHRIMIGGASPNNYPLLVTFTDIRDPKTVAKVDPDDLAASFGPGVKLRRITVQITDDPVTTGIEKRLSATGLQPNGGLDPTLGVTTNPTLAQQLGYSDFARR
jgi:hypothetical protein